MPSFIVSESNRLAIEEGLFHQAQSRQGFIETRPYYQVQQVMPRSVYVIGSLRNPDVPAIAEDIRERTGLRVFDDWYSAGPEADDYWKRYEQERGHDYISALAGAAARNVYEFDKRHLDAATDVVLVLPAGKSGHLELGYCAGKGKRTYILLEQGTDPRWDVMYQFADWVVENTGQLVEKMNA